MRLSTDEVNAIYAADTDAFYAWVASRRAGDNPRGDFIRDTRRILEVGRRNPACDILLACDEAIREHDKMMRQYANGQE